ncbi:MAG: lysostaphin resistance A-like protein [Bacteroidales bacterium]
MKHLEAAFSGKNAFWRYAIMTVAVFLASNTAGAIPLIVSLVLKAASDPETISSIVQNPAGLGNPGIGSNTWLFIMLFPFLAGVAAFALLIRLLNSRTVTETINGTTAIRWGRIIVSALIWIAISAIYLFVQRGINPDNFVLNNTSKTLVSLVIISVLFIPFQAAFEEILFRGYFMQGFAVFFRNRWAPLLLTSLFFALLHGANPEVKEFGFITMMPQYILFGLVFGTATILDDGIEIAFGAHTANNIFLSVMVTNKSSAIQTQAIFEQTVIHPWSEFGGLLISSVIFLVALKYIFMWKDFRKLFKKIDVSPE